jgi:hypothetical protein
MKTLFYMGRNDQNLSGVSWKIWKIERRGKRVKASWGAAGVIRRKVVPKYLLSRSWSFRSEQVAREDEQRRIAEKLSGGYQRTPKRKR